MLAPSVVCCVVALTLPPLLCSSSQLDMGQCNDAYSAIVVASKLAEVGAVLGVFGACPWLMVLHWVVVIAR